MEQLYLLRFQKTGGARFLSHLDMARLFTRSLRRAGLKLKLSEGFHAHPKIRFSPPLSVGVESLCEDCLFTLVDEERGEEELLRVLSGTMPDGFSLTSLSKAEHKPAPATHARYEITFPAGARDALERAFSAPMNVVKRTKSGEKDMDLFPHLVCEDIREDAGGCVCTLLTPASEPLTINPGLIVTALTKKEPSLIPARILKTAAVNR